MEEDGIKLKAVIIRTLDLQEEDFSETADFINDYLADSLEVVELIMNVEGIFKISIPDEDIFDVRSYNSLLEYINRIRSS